MSIKFVTSHFDVTSKQKTSHNALSTAFLMSFLHRHNVQGMFCKYLVKVLFCVHVGFTWIVLENKSYISQNVFSMYDKLRMLESEPHVPFYSNPGHIKLHVRMYVYHPNLNTRTFNLSICCIHFSVI